MQVEKGYEYKRTFCTFGKGKVIIADPCLLKKEEDADEWNTARIEVIPGVWTCENVVKEGKKRPCMFRMWGEGVDPAELVEMEAGAEVVKTDAGTSGFGVDSGQMGVIGAEKVGKWMEENYGRICAATSRNGKCFGFTDDYYVSETEHGDGKAGVKGVRAPSGRYRALFVYLP